MGRINRFLGRFSRFWIRDSKLSFVFLTNTFGTAFGNHCQLKRSKTRTSRPLRLSLFLVWVRQNPLKTQLVTEGPCSRLRNEVLWLLGWWIFCQCFREREATCTGSVTTVRVTANAASVCFSWGTQNKLTNCGLFSWTGTCSYKVFTGRTVVSAHEESGGPSNGLKAPRRTGNVSGTERFRWV